MKTMIHQVDF